MALKRGFSTWLVATSTAVIAACGGTEPATHPDASGTIEAARPFPNVGVTSLTGQSAPLPELARGRVTVVDLWATWCHACEAGHEALARLAKSQRDDELWIVAVDVGEEASVVQRYVATHSLVYPVFLDPKFALADALGETELPAIYVLDAQGRIVHRTTKLDHPTLERIRAELNAPQR